MLFGHMGNEFFPVCVASMARHTLPPWGGLYPFCLHFLLFILIHHFFPIWTLQLHRRPWSRGSSWGRRQLTFECGSLVGLRNRNNRGKKKRVKLKGWDCFLSKHLLNNIRQYISTDIPWNGPLGNSSEKTAWCTQGIWTHAPFDWLNECQNGCTAGTCV